MGETAKRILNPYGQEGWSYFQYRDFCIMLYSFSNIKRAQEELR
ncbi:hypothetical protein Amet_2271 [Alkaliphilus metalliredigens QYMF]|uniref:Uncharacterized protein n=1 Tax=Alkaliphilus metalliredigens (strain QYMF) TaxID=293826 RepID=A6TQG1_ALKMQ|nr:hypothetical protein Amet_2271 [Alkaliphilus metalliredigens QYMF]